LLKFNFGDRKEGSLKILCLGAHSDDIEIGCGGSILRLLSEYRNAEIYWVVLGSSGRRDQEALSSAKKFLKNTKKKKIIVNNFKDSFFPYMGGEIKNFFEKIIKKVSPDIVFTHYRHDLHQDHRLVSELTWNTFRNHFILEYEIMKYDGDIGVPNFFVHLDNPICQNKIRIIMDSFQTQRGKDWFTSEVLYSILRLRGMESKAPGDYAEGFYCRKLIF
jgi:LmbE family N-acetylglucosaminyl deacetylase